MIVKTADWDSEGGNLVEAGIDNFRVDHVLNINPVNAELDYSIYPNPSNGVFNLVFGTDVPETLIINVYDVSGKLVTSSNVKKDNAKINIEDAGIYIIIMVGENYISSPMKVVKL